MNFGGGFGVPLTDSDPVVDLEVVSTALDSARRQLTVLEPSVGIQMEAGRYIFAEAGVYIAEIIDVKRSRGQNFAVVDRGVSGFSRPMLRWGEDHPLWIRGMPYDAEGQSEWQIVGRTCLPGDRLGILRTSEVDLVGRQVVVLNAGAYGREMTLIEWGSLGSAVGEITLE
jgi:diaminopimelate decarboxylase